MFSAKAACQIPRKPDQGAKIPDLILQSAPLCLCILLEGKKAERPDDYFVLTLGLPAPPESDRVAAKTEPYPGRWITHFVISSPSDLDKELGDVAWYLAEATTALDIPLETVFQGNLDKLWQRFSNGFDTGASVNRKEDDL